MLAMYDARRRTSRKLDYRLAPRMNTVLCEDEQLLIPSSVTDLDSFRRWSDSDEFPDFGRVWYLQGGVWVDMSKEDIFSHNQVKTEFTVVLGGLANTEQTGRYFSDGAFLTNQRAGISGQPDGTFVGHETLRRAKVRLVHGKHGNFVELEGTPDIVLEIVSRGSVRKDTVWLREAYWEAGISEYWLVDARREPIRFEMFRHTPKGYVLTRKQSGWVRSVVFKMAFCLKQDRDEMGHPVSRLQIR